MGGLLCRSGRYWGTWACWAWVVRPMGCAGALDSGRRTDCGNGERGGSHCGSFVGYGGREYEQSLSEL